MLYHSFRLLAAASIGALALRGAPALRAQQTPAAPPPDAPATTAGDDLHDRRLDEQEVIVVTGVGLERLDVLAGTSVIEGGDLQEQAAGQIGEVLDSLPGVSASGFSPGASRPVLRGFSGERVRVLVDGIGAIDVSNTSADHAVTIDPLTAERIEVLRGPAVLLYGGSAIGGAVNVIDKRIPRRVPSEPVHFDALLRADAAADTREAGASLDVPVTPSLVGHVDASWRRSNDLEIGGYQVAPGLRAELLARTDSIEAGGDPRSAAELREDALHRGTVPNTATRTWTANAGLGYFAGDSNLGAAVGVYDTSYGIPSRPGAEEENVSIGLHQLRADMRGEAAFGGAFVDTLHVRAGYSDYTHTEFEGEEVGTVFDVRGIESRAEFEQAERGGWRGSFGAQFYFRDFAAAGEEAYIAPNTTDQFALFALQEFGTGPVEIEGAARLEATNVEAPTRGLTRDFRTFSSALGVSYQIDPALRAGLNLTRAARAPSAEELYSNGPHIATQAVEIGNPQLSTETAWGAEAYLRGALGPLDVNLAVYRSWFSDYIYQAATGVIEDGLPVLAYRQADARYTGAEGQVSWAFFDRNPVSMVLDIGGDIVRADLTDGTALPRIPPLSLTAGIEAQTDPLDARLEVAWTADQGRTAPFETATDGFTLVNASVSWRPLRGNDNVSLVLKADNIFDVVGRRHASFTKDFVPLAVRNLSASVRLSF